MSLYEQSYKRLNKAQKEAVDTIDGPVLVIAGPGTGKTQLLTTRVAHILSTTDALPENILCLTFTDAAALTMRERLIQMIGQAAYDVSISTFHAFGNELIQRYPEFYSQLSDLKPIDELSSDGILRNIIDKLSYSHPLKFANNYIGDLRSFISDAKRGLLTPAHIKQVVVSNQEFITTNTDVVQSDLAHLRRVDMRSIGQFQSLLKDIKKISSKQLPSGIVPLSQLFSEELKQAIEEAEQTNRSTALTKWKDRWLAKDDAGSFIIDGNRVCQRLEAAADIYEQYADVLSKQGLFDFDDMIVVASRVLEENDDLRYSLQERYQYIMIDEFQDTNGVQLRLTELLTNNPISEGRPNVMAVGDDDQAIYAFQGAHYSHILRFYEMYRDVKVITLTENYRSNEAILHLADGVVRQINQRLDHINPDTPPKVIRVADGSKTKPGVLERREAISDVEELTWTAQTIASLIRSGVNPDEIAILAPQHKYLEPLVPFLHTEQIPVRYEKRENILDSNFIQQLLVMSELLIALNHHEIALANSLWPKVLSFDFWQLPTSHIWELSWQADMDHQSWTEILINDPQSRLICLFFIRLSELSDTSPLETMIDYLIGSEGLDLKEPDSQSYQSPLYQYYFGEESREHSTADFWNLLTDLIILRARLRVYRPDKNDALSLPDFINFIYENQLAGIKILNTNPYQEADHAVTMMTAYKAKGQEFEVVFMLGCSDEIWGTRSRGAQSHIALPINLRYIRYERTSDDERLRLVYVAITRAKSQLYLASYKRDYAGKPTTPLKYFQETDADDGTTISSVLPKGLETVLQVNPTVKPPSLELSSYWQGSHIKALSNVSLQDLLKPRLKLFQLSPTNIVDFTDVSNAGPEVFLLKALLRFPSAPNPREQYGSTIHECLLWIHDYNATHSKLPSQVSTLKVFDQKLEARRLSQNDRTLLKERGHRCLSAYLAQRGSTINSDNVCEYSFRNEGVFIDKAHLSGKIDKLIIDKANKTIIIVDYKTGAPHKKWSREVSLHRYRRQLYCYKLLVENSRHFKGYKVIGGYIEFVEPDELGHINELRLEFDETELEHIRQLIGSIWQHIQALNLPDTSMYPPDLKGIEQFEIDLLAQ